MDNNTSIKKRKLSFGLYAKEEVPSLEELEHLIKMNSIISSNENFVDIENNIDKFSNEIISIPDNLINKLHSDDDEERPNKDNRGNKNSRNSKTSQTSRNFRNSRNSNKNNKNDKDEKDNNSSVSGFWKNRKKSRINPEREEEWYDYDKYFTDYVKNTTAPCENPICDHKIHEESWYDNNKITITVVNTLDDLIYLGSFYHCKMRVEHNEIDLKILYTIKEPLTELNNMIGLTKIKEEIVNTIIYFLLTKNLSKEINSDMMHAVITGSPGCGKTTFIDILAKIYVGLGCN